MTVPHSLPVAHLSAWWREAFEMFVDTRTAVPMCAGASRSSSSARLPFDLRMLRAFMAGRAATPAVYRSTDPGQP